MDLAITPVRDDEIETREMFQSAEARNYVVKIHRTEKMRRGGGVTNNERMIHEVTRTDTKNTS